ncbi:hypothetical protein CERZMDRAFT_96915 [Cercospora zeae-maydis SCOH1-5]|uniref:Uncharacterized protein n=1 Tax=Cercospora zeae-maydis SCOH1-5 TaxID=717836 RepID=A0A6A6FIM1_9PEZI|nr:hypothetical protein CERZMDRAFT_96915 [Cercospora zeae-maydis SCOH1-5]
MCANHMSDIFTLHYSNALGLDLAAHLSYSCNAWLLNGLEGNCTRMIRPDMMQGAAGDCVSVAAAALSCWAIKRDFGFTVIVIPAACATMPRVPYGMDQGGILGIITALLPATMPLTTSFFPLKAPLTRDAPPNSFALIGPCVVDSDI